MASAQPENYRCPTVRAAKRVDFRAVVQFRAGSRRAEVKVLDISVEGARVSAVHSLRVGERLYLKLPRLEPIEGVVAWSKEFELGCRFVTPLHPAVFDMVVATA